eukprot:1208859-Pyramimonas_sp.AAC.1
MASPARPVTLQAADVQARGSERSAPEGLLHLEFLGSGQGILRGGLRSLAGDAASVGLALALALA